MRALRFARFSLAPAILAAMVLSGCGKDSVKPTENGVVFSDPYPVLSTPQNVLSALEEAYSHRDSVEYKALYDPSYVGISRDQNDPPGTAPITLTYADEVAHVAKLASWSTITSAYMSLGPSASWTRLASNDTSHPEWADIQIAGSSLNVRVTEGTDTYEAGGSSLFFEFMFKPTTPAPSSPTDTL